MLKRLIYGGLVFCTVLGLFLACATAAGEDQAPAATKTLAPSPAARQAWENEWDKITQVARQEGTLVILTDMSSDTRQKLSEAVGTKYGVRLEFVLGRPAELATSLLAQYNAGLYMADVYVSGVTTAVLTFKPAGVLETLDPMLVLPEVKDTKAWSGGRIPYTDRDHIHIGFLSTVLPELVVNTELVQPDEIKSYRDLLNPKWKGKIVVNDPTIGGMGLGSFVALAEGMMGLDFLRELGKQELEINRDNRLQVEWVARGKYPIGLFLKPEQVLEFIKAGAPIKYVIPKEGTHVSSSTGGISLIKHAPHLNAAKLFLNWLLTKEGQTLFSRSFSGQSLREDVPTDHVIPEYRRQPGMKYWDDSSEEATILKDKYTKVTRDVWGQYLK